jgi:Na+-transporting methylmalonyl-CoA/oxaloacetate decarboxylase beta subunit
MAYESAAPCHDRVSKKISLKEEEDNFLILELSSC